MEPPTVKRRPSARAKHGRPSALLPAIYVRLEPHLDDRLRLIALRRRRSLTDVISDMIAQTPVPSEVMP